MTSSGLDNLEKELYEELRLLELPAKPWLQSKKEPTLDVAIIGGGMAGLASAFGLIKLGINNIQLFDLNKQGYEGPWNTYARMLILRSPKNLSGPALSIPKLTFQAYFVAKYGKEAWDSLYKIKTPEWMEYLSWYKKVLRIPVENKMEIADIQPHHDHIELVLEKGEPIFARKVVLATGRAGFGKVEIPSYMAHIPQEYYAHTFDEIDYSALKEKEIAILGAGASGFDILATLLEQGAKSATILLRRPNLPQVNKFASTTYPGFSFGFYELPDQAKMEIMSYAFDVGMPPPFESLDRVKNYSNFNLLSQIEVKDVRVQDKKVLIKTDRKSYTFDFIVLATGFQMDGSKEKELTSIFPDIQLWQDLYPNLPDSLKGFPYLGKHYEFTEKVNGAAPYLKNIYCFNYAATLSHGNTSGDIPDISTGAERLTQGIVEDFFREDWPEYFKRLQNYNDLEFQTQNYPFLKHD